MNEKRWSAIYFGLFVIGLSLFIFYCINGIPFAHFPMPIVFIIAVIFPLILTLDYLRR